MTYLKWFGWNLILAVVMFNEFNLMKTYNTENKDRLIKKSY